MLDRLLCRILGHRTTRIPRDDEGGGYLLRCERCGREGLRPDTRRR
jgi:hypothetical protein